MTDSSSIHISELELRLAQFNKLLAELIRGRIRRTTFQPWEIDLLLDIEACDLRNSNRRELLKRYQRAANRFVDRGGRSILKLSEYIEKRHRRIGSAPTAAGDD